MPLIVSETKSDFKPVPEGVHQARCYMIIDLGTEYSERYQKFNRKVLFTWELAELMEDGKPFTMSKEYTLSLGERANLRHDLVSWRGRQFTGDELKSFDLYTVLNAQCLLNIVHKVTDQGKTRSEISSITQLVKGMPKMPPINEALTLNLDPAEYSMATFDELPNWIKEKIKKSPEWQSLEGAKPVPQGNYQVDENLPPMEDDIPF